MRPDGPKAWLSLNLVEEAVERDVMAAGYD